MGYTTVAKVASLTGFKDGSGDAGGIIANAISAANLAVKARIKKAGLTPPTGSNDDLDIAEQYLARANMRMRIRMDGSLPAGQGSPDTFDSTNKAVKTDTDLAFELIDGYIYQAKQFVPSTSTGVSRADYTFGDMKLDQGTITKPVVAV